MASWILDLGRFLAPGEQDVAKGQSDLGPDEVLGLVRHLLHEAECGRRASMAGFGEDDRVLKDTQATGVERQQGGKKSAGFAKINSPVG